MKTIIRTSLSISVCFIVYIERLKISHSNEVSQNDSTITWFNQRYEKDSTLKWNLTNLPSQEVINENELIIKHFGK